ncbi:MAG: acyltransferase family protein [Alistipes sp.]|nr:acyltransferase family protein [Alistipes sp.]MBQ5691931.1 acyltransferase family protein [Alistipes sp.]
MNKRIVWLDYGKGLCMLLVILFHTWAYYASNGIAILRWIEPFFLTLFFFITGYLTNIKTFDLKKQLVSIIQKLLLPYIIFETITWFPKALSHGYDLNLISAVKDILGGYAGWYVAALVCTKLTLSFILQITKQLKSIWVFTAIVFVIGLCLSEFVLINLPWYLDKGLIALFYVVLGMTYREYEDKEKQISTTFSIISLLVYVVAIYINSYVFEYMHCVYQMSRGNVDIIKAIPYMIVSVFAIWIVVNFLKRIPSNFKWLSYIGENSLIFYFLNGGVLTVMILIFNKIGLSYQGNNWNCIILFGITIGVLYVVSYLIMRFAPWMVGNFKTTKMSKDKL